MCLSSTVSQRGEWIPLECAPVGRALATAYDEIDRRFLRFLGERYCVASDHGAKAAR